MFKFTKIALLGMILFPFSSQAMMQEENTWNLSRSKYHADKKLDRSYDYVGDRLTRFVENKNIRPLYSKSKPTGYNIDQQKRRLQNIVTDDLLNPASNIKAVRPMVVNADLDNTQTTRLKGINRYRGNSYKKLWR